MVGLPGKIQDFPHSKFNPQEDGSSSVSVYNKLSRSLVFQLNMHMCMFLFVCVFVCQFTMYHEDGLSFGGTGALKATYLLVGCA